MSGENTVHGSAESDDVYVPPNPDFPHLTPDGARHIYKSNDERIRVCKLPYFVGHTAASRFLVEVTWRVSLAPRRRIPHITLRAPSGMGKSEMLKFVASHFPVCAVGSSGVLSTPVITCSLEGIYTVKGFMYELRRAAGVPRPDRKMEPAEEVDEIVALLNKAGCVLLILDEVQDLAAARSNERMAVVLLIKRITNKALFACCAAGTEDEMVIFADSSHMLNRFRPFDLEQWKADEEFMTFMYCLVGSLPLKSPSSIVDAATCQEIIAASSGVTEPIAEAARFCAVAAIESGSERLDKDTFMSKLWSIRDA